MATILHIDDDPLVLKAIGRYLIRMGYEVVSSESGENAEALFEEHQPDILVLDVAMPVRSGLEVYDAIREKFHAVPVLFCTGYAESFQFDSEEKIRRWHERFSDGCTDMIYKPFKLEELGEKVEALDAMQGMSHG